MAKLIDITGKVVSGEWGTTDESGDGIPVLRTTNFTNEGAIDFCDVITRTIIKKNIDEKYLRQGDIIIEKSGGSDKQPVGRVVYFNGLEKTYLFNNFTGLLRVKDQKNWYPKYVFYSLYFNYLRGGTRVFESKTTGLHNLRINDFVSRYEVPETNIAEQKKICELLDRLSNIVRKRKQELQMMDELIKARFVEMFEDTGQLFAKYNLGEIADIVSGITKGRKTKDTDLQEVPYMAVSNVKDGYIDWTKVKTIMASSNEITQYRLKPGDILMTEGGDPDKLGRGSIIINPPENCIHQNHIFRVRFSNGKVLPRYFAGYLQSPLVKKYFLRAAKQTTGIASINMKQLKNLPIVVPPVATQEAYISFVENIDKSKNKLQSFQLFCHNIPSINPLGA